MGSALSVEHRAPGLLDVFLMPKEAPCGCKSVSVLQELPTSSAAWPPWYRSMKAAAARPSSYSARSAESTTNASDNAA